MVQRLKGRKRWLVAAIAALAATVEVIAPHATPLAQAVVRILDPELEVAEQRLGERGLEVEPKPSVSSLSNPLSAPSPASSGC